MDEELAGHSASASSDLPRCDFCRTSYIDKRSHVVQLKDLYHEKEWKQIASARQGCS